MKCWSTRCRNDLKFTERANLWQKNGNDLVPLTRNTGASRQHSSALGALREAKLQSVIYQAKLQIKYKSEAKKFSD